MLVLGVGRFLMREVPLYGPPRDGVFAFTSDPCTQLLANMETLRVHIRVHVGSYGGTMSHEPDTPVTFLSTPSASRSTGVPRS